MALIEDKCSCGSPRVLAKSRRGDGVTSLNRKLDPPAPKSTKNEYTRTTADNRKKMTASTNAGHAQSEESNNARNARHQSHQHRRHMPSNGVTSPSNNDDIDSELGTTNRKSTNRKWSEDETGSSSNYTALNYDVNYVRVSPPKMTRRLKPQPETEVKITREAQLAASRAASSRGEAGTPLPDITSGNNTKTPPVKPRTTLLQRDVAKTPVPTPATVDGDSQPREAGTTRQETKPASSESDYISLSDLQASLAQSQLTSAAASKPEVVSVPEVDECRAVSATMYNDGDNSFLELTLTVRLPQDSGRPATDSDQNHPQPAAAQPQLVTVAGGRKDTTITVKPVISVRAEKRASSAGSKVTKKPVGIAGIQVTANDDSRQHTVETGSRPSSAGTQQSVLDRQQVCKSVFVVYYTEH